MKEAVVQCHVNYLRGFAPQPNFMIFIKINTQKASLTDATNQKDHTKLKVTAHGNNTQ